MTPPPVRKPTKREIAAAQEFAVVKVRHSADEVRMTELKAILDPLLDALPNRKGLIGGIPLMLTIYPKENLSLKTCREQLNEAAMQLVEKLVTTSQVRVVKVG